MIEKKTSRELESIHDLCHGSDFSLYRYSPEDVIQLYYANIKYRQTSLFKEVTNRKLDDFYLKESNIR